MSHITECSCRPPLLSVIEYKFITKRFHETQFKKKLYYHLKATAVGRSTGSSSVHDIQLFFLMCSGPQNSVLVCLLPKPAKHWQANNEKSQ